MYKIYFNPLNGEIIPSQEYFEYDPAFTNYHLFDLKNIFNLKDFEIFIEETDGYFIMMLATENTNVAQFPKMYTLLPENTKLSFAQNYDKKWYVCCWLEFNTKVESVIYLLKQ